LGAAPSVVFIKNRSDSEEWRCGFTALSSNFSSGVHLSTNDGAWTQSGAFNDTAPSSTVFTVGNFNSVNGDGDNLIAYCFAEKRGFSQFGKYISNNTVNNGPFVFTGFAPAFVLTKITSTGGSHWRIFDNKRDGFNGANQYLQPDTTGTESNNDPSQIDLLSNGFKLRGAEGDSNYNTETVIYMAFAENPLVDSTGKIPATAR
jgi:hypothetical protein